MAERQHKKSDDMITTVLKINGKGKTGHENKKRQNRYERRRNNEAVRLERFVDADESPPPLNGHVAKPK